MDRSPPDPPTKQLANAMFGIDVRTLALFRIALAIVLLANLATRAIDLNVMYTDSGVLPVETIRGYFAGHWRWSLHWLSGDLWWQITLFIAAIVAAFALLAGYHTRVATGISWVLLTSLHTRQPLLVNGGDVILSLLLFWSIFLPLGNRASIDSKRQVVLKKPSQTILNVATAAILLQVCMMYFFTGLAKCNTFWYRGEAIANSLNIDLYVTSLGTSLRTWPTLLQTLSLITLSAELLLPVLLLLPWFRYRIRLVALVILVGLHVGIELCLNVALFSYACFAAHTLFLPTNFWESARIQKGLQWCHRWTKQNTPPVATTNRTKTRRPSLAKHMSNGFCLAMLFYISAYNIRILVTEVQPASKAWQAFDRIGELTVVGQRWSMFSKPNGRDFRFVIAGLCSDGQTVDLTRNGIPLVEDTVKGISADKSARQWVTFWTELHYDHNAWFRHDILEYFVRQWNASHPPERWVVEADFRYVNQASTTALEAVGATTENTQTQVIAWVDSLGEGEYEFFPQHLQWVRHGSWILRSVDQTKLATGEFEVGQPVGPWVYYYADGSKKAAGHYHQGKRQGNWTFWNVDGTTFEAKFNAGKRVDTNLSPQSSLRSRHTPSAS